MSKMKCPSCNNTNTNCSHEYDSDGASMEWYDYVFTCLDCGFEQRDSEHHCYGFDNDYDCPFCGASGKCIQ